MHVDELVRVAVDGDFNFVSIRGELGKIYVAEVSHRGYSGPSHDTSGEQLERWAKVRTELRFELIGSTSPSSPHTASNAA